MSRLPRRYGCRRFSKPASCDENHARRSVDDLDKAARDANWKWPGAGRRWLSALVISEMAVAVTLLVAGGLMLKSFHRLQALDLGFQPDNLLSVRMDLPGDKYPDQAQRAAFLSQLLERVRALPGVVSAGATTNLPLSHSSIDMRFTVEGQAARNPGEVPFFLP